MCHEGCQEETVFAQGLRGVKGGKEGHCQEGANTTHVWRSLSEGLLLGTTAMGSSLSRGCGSLLLAKPTGSVLKGSCHSKDKVSHLDRGPPASPLSQSPPPPRSHSTPQPPSVPAMLGAAERHLTLATDPCHSHGTRKKRMLSVSSPVALRFASPTPSGSPAPSWPTSGLKLAHAHLFRGEDPKRQRLSLSSGLSSSTDGSFPPSPHHSGGPRMQEPSTERRGKHRRCRWAAGKAPRAGTATHRTVSPRAPRAWRPPLRGSPAGEEGTFPNCFSLPAVPGPPIAFALLPKPSGMLISPLTSAGTSCARSPRACFSPPPCTRGALPAGSQQCSRRKC